MYRDKKDRRTYELLTPPFFALDCRIGQVLTVKTVKFCACASGKRCVVCYISVVHFVSCQTFFCGHHIDVDVHVAMYVYVYVYVYAQRCRTSLVSMKVPMWIDVKSMAQKSNLLNPFCVCVCVCVYVCVCVCLFAS